MTLLPPLCACAVCLVIGKGNQAYSDFPLENPACIDQYKQPSATIRELSGLLNRPKKLPEPIQAGCMHRLSRKTLSSYPATMP